MEVRVWGVILGLCLTGCGNQASQPNSRFVTAPSVPDSYSNPYGIDSSMIKFQDHLESNAEPTEDLLSLEFTGSDGHSQPLKDFALGKNLVLVMTRGYSGSICPYCTTQVSRMIANFSEFEKRNTKVVVVYPLAKQEDTQKRDDFVSRAVSMLPKQVEVPFPILLDVELKGVDALGIRKDLSKPATYILDGEGRLQFAYVGNTLADRPSVQALLEQLDKINQTRPRS